MREDLSRSYKSGPLEFGPFARFSDGSPSCPGTAHAVLPLIDRLFPLWPSCKLIAGSSTIMRASYSIRRSPWTAAFFSFFCFRVAALALALALALSFFGPVSASWSRRSYPFSGRAAIPSIYRILSAGQRNHCGDSIYL
jgi:hypothetical protein